MAQCNDNWDVAHAGGRVSLKHEAAHRGPAHPQSRPCSSSSRHRDRRRTVTGRDLGFVNRSVRTASGLFAEYVDEPIGLAKRRRFVGNLGAIVRGVAQEIRVGDELEPV